MWNIKAINPICQKKKLTEVSGSVNSGTIQIVVQHQKRQEAYRQ